MTFAATAAAAQNAPYGFDGDPNQYWVDVLASAFDGIIMLPFALFFVWGIHRLNLNRWLPLTAALATVLAVAVSGLIQKFVAPVFAYSHQMLGALGVYRFEYMLLPGLLVCFAGGLALAWSRKRHGPIEARL
jgi:hypothetical protein